MDALCGYIGGATGILATHPLDTIKTNIQNERNVTTRRRSSTIQIIRKIHGKGGILKFYSGVIPQVVFRGIPFGVNIYFVNYFKEKKHFSPSLSGSLAGILQTLVDNPIVLIKTRAQIISNKKVKETIPAYVRMLNEIWRHESFSGLYSGVYPRFLINGIGFGVFYTIYENLKNQNYSPFFSASIAVIPSWFTIYPLEIVSVRQMSRVKQTKFDKKFYTFRKELKNLHWRNSFNGFGICAIRAIPRYGITLSTTEKCKIYFYRRNCRFFEQN